MLAPAGQYITSNVLARAGPPDFKAFSTNFLASLSSTKIVFFDSRSPSVKKASSGLTFSTILTFPEFELRLKSFMASLGSWLTIDDECVEITI